VSGKSAAEIADSAMRIMALLESSVEQSDDSTLLSKARIRVAIGDAVLEGVDGVVVGVGGGLIRFGFFEQCVDRWPNLWILSVARHHEQGSGCRCGCFGFVDAGLVFGGFDLVRGGVVALAISADPWAETLSCGIDSACAIFQFCSCVISALVLGNRPDGVAWRRSSRGRRKEELRPCRYMALVNSSMLTQLGWSADSKSRRNVSF
jgi:hypothetical protein